MFILLSRVIAQQSFLASEKDTVKRGLLFAVKLLFKKKV